MSRIPTLIQAELIGVPLYLYKSQKNNNPCEQRIVELETGILKAHLTLSSMKNVFTDPVITEWNERLEKLLDYPGTPLKTSYRLEILEKETEYGIELLGTSIRSPVLKLLHDFLIAARNGKICEYYQRISKEQAGLLIEFSSKIETQNNTQEDLPMRN
jgi:hypothetical protein